MIVIEIVKRPSGHYTVEYSRSFNNTPSVKFDVISTPNNFDTAMNEARKLARSYKREGQSVVLRIHGAGKNKDGRFAFGADKKFHKE